jgi:hypothetical protein
VTVYRVYDRADRWVATTRNAVQARNLGAALGGTVVPVIRQSTIRERYTEGLVAA